MAAFWWTSLLQFFSVWIFTSWDNLHVYISSSPYMERFSSHQQNRECKLLVFLLTGIGLSLTLHPNFPLVTRREIVSLTIMWLLATYKWNIDLFEMAIYSCKSSSQNSFSLWTCFAKTYFKRGQVSVFEAIMPKTPAYLLSTFRSQGFQ